MLAFPKDPRSSRTAEAAPRPTRSLAFRRALRDAGHPPGGSDVSRDAGLTERPTIPATGRSGPASPPIIRAPARNARHGPQPGRSGFIRDAGLPERPTILANSRSGPASDPITRVPSRP